ncbi:MAG: hypothetical protein V9G12_14610 [Microthrixaceae bacterium]
MSLHRSVVAAALAATLLTAGCSDDSSADPTPVTAGPTTSVAPTTTAGIETTTTVAQAATSTTSVSPPVTKPLTTAPPSELLTEVTAAYDAAYADLLAATIAGDENSPALANHIAGAQLETGGESFVGSVPMVTRARPHDSTVVVACRVDRRWRRHSAVSIEVCRFDNRTRLIRRAASLIERITAIPISRNARTS